MKIEFNGSVIVVTGGATSIGLAISRQLAESGAKVFVCDVLEDEGLQAVDAIKLSGGSAEFRSLDVTNEDEWSKLASELEGFSSVSGLVNNAGVGGAMSVTEETLDGWANISNVNQLGVFLGMKHIGPIIESKGGGCIVNLASIFSTSGGFGNAIAYHASKGAVMAMTRTAAVQWSTRGVRVNAIHPGFIGTPMTLQHKDLVLESGDTLGDLILSGTPMKRLGTPEEIANVVTFMLSTQASYMTGASVYVDGGWSAI